jgi:hypothetical protein
MSPKPGRSGRRRRIVAGARVRHILSAQGVAVRVEGNRVHVLWDDNGEELILAGFLEAIPCEFTCHQAGERGVQRVPA